MSEHRHWHGGTRHNETRMPPRVITHCGRHMRFAVLPLWYWCPMCLACETMESVEARV